MKYATEKDRILSPEYTGYTKQVRWSYIREITFSFIISSGMLLMGFLVGSTSMLPKILNENSNKTFTSEDLKYLASMPILLQIPFNIFTLYLTEKFGPTCILRWCLLCGVLCYLLLVVVMTLTTLWISRICMTAVAYGIIGNIIVALIAEISEPEIRGLCGALPGLMLSFGILYAYVAYSYLDGIAATISNAVPVILGLLGSAYVPESPYWLLKNGKNTKAAQSIARIIGPTRQEKQVDSYNETALLYENNSQLSEQDRTEASRIYQLSLLRKSKNWKPLLLIHLVFLFREFGGISTIFYYILLVFQKAEVSADAFTCTIIGGVIRLISTIITSFLQDKCGRRSLLMTTTLVSGVCLLVSGLILLFEIAYLKIVALVAIMVYIFAINMGLGSTSFLLLGEIIPMEIKFLGNSIVNSSTSFLWFIIICTGPSMIRLIGVNVLFIIFSFVNFAACLTFYFVLPETKQKTLTQLDNLYE